MPDPITTKWNASQERFWQRDCLHWHGIVLTGKYRHWCAQWDALPVDETCMEWPCGCFTTAPAANPDYAKIDALIAKSIDMLLAAGMVMQYRSSSGCSYYLGWPGRSGALRVSNHPSKPSKNDINRTYARITINEHSIPGNDGALERITACALGRYLMHAPFKSAPAAPSEPAAP
jgi:hypothetical protein